MGTHRTLKRRAQRQRLKARRASDVYEAGRQRSLPFFNNLNEILAHYYQRQAMDGLLHSMNVFDALLKRPYDIEMTGRSFTVPIQKRLPLEGDE